jgi:hypothetical protein
MELRTQAINTARGLVKSCGQRLAACDPDNATRKLAEHLDASIRGHVERLLQTEEGLTKQIGECDEDLERIAQEHGAVAAGVGSGADHSADVHPDAGTMRRAFRRAGMWDVSGTAAEKPAKRGERAGNADQ